MFNLQSEVNRLQQLQYAKIHGLPYKPKQYDPKVSHIDEGVFEIQAMQEGIAIPKGFHNHSRDFGKRLSKVKGQKHHPGGGFAGHTIRG